MTLSCLPPLGPSLPTFLPSLQGGMFISSCFHAESLIKSFYPAPCSLDWHSSSHCAQQPRSTEALWLWEDLLWWSPTCRAPMLQQILISCPCKPRYSTALNHKGTILLTYEDDWNKNTGESKRCGEVVEKIWSCHALLVGNTNDRRDWRADWHFPRKLSLQENQSRCSCNKNTNGKFIHMVKSGKNPKAH